MARSGSEEALLAAGRSKENLDVREEVKRQLWLAGPMIAGGLLRYVIQMISVMYVGHLGELPLAGASNANSFATVTGFSLLVCTFEMTFLTSMVFASFMWLIYTRCSI